ncbi:ion channel [Sulfitobacter aestuariivivens]|uniref:Two pore domain potassium channel family protein n=1 Tax=Sulfitobacter aestuariivivens TaxID=2766981 RepID=A0A927D0B7_9RHOB|nr:ion channel [Sulfitobacter aestuariivivens]MBD3662674.1 two pore domain potassium channel family protein [Sulfitobacter aestuariivivens]
MGLWEQIAYGSIILALCSAIHLGLIIFSLPYLNKIAEAQRARFSRRRAARVIGFAFVIVLTGHVIQVWLWAVSYLWLEAMRGLEPALYFSLSNYTTLGYGDLVLGEDLRLFGAFASVNGMLIFGVSTAYLVGIIGRVLPKGLH